MVQEVSLGDWRLSIALEQFASTALVITALHVPSDREFTQRFSALDPLPSPHAASNPKELTTTAIAASSVPPLPSLQRKRKTIERTEEVAETKEDDALTKKKKRKESSETPTFSAAAFRRTLFDLPVEILRHIVSFVPPLLIPCLRTVSRCFQTAIDHPSFWLVVCRLHFDDQTPYSDDLKTLGMERLRKFNSILRDAKSLKAKEMAKHGFWRQVERIMASPIHCSPDLYGKALEHACYDGNLEIVSLVLETGILSKDPYIANSCLPASITNAITKGHFDAADMLLERHGLEWVKKACEIDGGYYLLLEAAEHDNNVKWCRLLLEASVEASDLLFDGSRVLDVAVEKGNMELAELLISHGAVPFRAVATEVLLAHNPDWLPQLWDRCISPFYHSSISLVKYEAAKLQALSDYLSRDPSLVDRRDVAQQTPLHRAATTAHRDLLRLLLSKGADVNAVDGRGRTPLHLVAEGNGVDLARELLDGGADVNARAEHSMTPIHTAVMCDNLEMVELLHQRGADLTARTDPTGPFDAPRTPLDLASYIKIIEYLKSAMTG